MQIINDFYGECKNIFKKAVKILKSSDRRIILAQVAKELKIGGHTKVAKEFNIGRDTLRKGLKELETGIKCVDAFNMRGSKKTEYKLPNLLKDIKEIADSQSQTDPKFQSTRLYTRLTIAEFRKQLKKQKKYRDYDLPTNQTLTTIINKLGYNTKKIQKTKPLKKIPETNAIFDNLQKIHKEYEHNNNVARISIDAKDRVKIGDFSRGGKSRTTKKALDHDFGKYYYTPFGILDVKKQDVDIILTKSKLTADFIADQIEIYWFENYSGTEIDTLLINADNGPENSSIRTQFIKRMVEFSNKNNIKIILAYYPPYHSKYNPIERVWGALEQHWNGDIMDSEETILKFAQTMTWKGKNPTVKTSDNIYNTGISLTKKAMKVYEDLMDRMEGLEKWFVTISPRVNTSLLELIT